MVSRSYPPCPSFFIVPALFEAVSVFSQAPLYLITVPDIRQAELTSGAISALRLQQPHQNGIG
jgi:hypothetical protein